MFEASIPAVVEARIDHPFHSVLDFARRTGLSRPVLARLAAADAFGSLGLNRRQALWQVLTVGETLPLFAPLDEEEALPACFQDLPLDKQVVADYATIGLSLKAHPISLVRPLLDEQKILPTGRLVDLKDKAPVKVAGLVICRQMPSTAKGTIFMTLEDETGTANLVVWPRMWDKYASVVYGTTALVAVGKVEKARGVIHVIPTHLEDLSQNLRGIGNTSRDFH